MIKHLTAMFIVGVGFGLASQPLASKILGKVHQDPEPSIGPVEVRPGLPSSHLAADQMECLSKTIYFESNIESLEGQLAVAKVVLDRLASPSFPDTICGVVEESRKAGRYNCQFTWFCDGKSDRPDDKREYLRSQLVALMATSGFAEIIISQPVTHYHADYVNPDWNRSERMQPVTKIGRHLFYLEQQP